jgi:DNA-binding GntR family transcriptional regulator
MDERFQFYLQSAPTLSAAVYLWLKEYVLEERDRNSVSEGEITELLGVSRTPVREAMQRLAAEGLVEMAKGRRAKVTGITKKDIKDIFTILKALQTLSGELCAANVTDSQLDELEEILSVMEMYVRRDDYAKTAFFNTKFHQLIALFSGNKWLYNIMTNLFEYSFFYRKKSISTQGRAENAFKEHVAIFEALKTRNSKKVRKLMEAHVDHAVVDDKA